MPKNHYRWNSTSNDDMITKLKQNDRLQPIVENAMRAVDRGDFAPKDPYVDCPLSIGYSATISAPHMHAHALECFVGFAKEGASVLDVGCGSGVMLALFSKMVGPTGKVVGIDYIPELVELSRTNVQKNHSGELERGEIVIKCGDGWQGVSEHAPYDVIHVGAAPTEIPQALLDQLKPSGRLIIPVGGSENQVFTQVEKREDGTLDIKELFGVRYVPLVKIDKGEN